LRLTPRLQGVPIQIFIVALTIDAFPSFSSVSTQFGLILPLYGRFSCDFFFLSDTPPLGLKMPHPSSPPSFSLQHSTMLPLGNEFR
jgi:hypothetical protein